MPGYRYRITVEPLTDNKGAPMDQPTLTFEADNHDNILKIVEYLQGRPDLDFGAEKTASFAVGLKLFSEVLIEHRKHPVFAPLRDPFRAFMKGLKKGPEPEEV